MTNPAWFSAADQHALVSIGGCADALAVALRAAQVGEERRADPPRSILGVGNGQLLVMPSTSTGHIGVKLLTVADPAVCTGSPRIQGVHVQFDAVTLTPSAILDGIALTNTRTAAASVLALRALADPGSSELLVFGAGPQASSHVRGIAAEWPIRRVRLVSRRPESARLLAGELAGILDGIDVVALSPDEVEYAVADADVIVCATASATPVFAGSPRDGSAIVAVGSHSPVERELPGALMRRAYVVVEDRATALRGRRHRHRDRRGCLHGAGHRRTSRNSFAALSSPLTGRESSRAWAWPGRTPWWPRRFSRGPSSDSWVGHAEAGDARRAGFELPDMAEDECAQELAQRRGAYAPVKTLTIAPNRSSAMSSMLSAPATISATSQATFKPVRTLVGRHAQMHTGQVGKTRGPGQDQDRDQPGRRHEIRVVEHR